MQAFGLATIGRDAEIRYTPDGQAVANLSLAFSFGKKGEDGKRQTQWVDGSIWGKRAEALAPYLLKGTKVSVTLEDVRQDTFTRADNTTGTKIVGRVLAIDLASSPKPTGAPAPAPARAAPAAAKPAAAAQPTGFDDMDDDIPFALSLNDFSIASSKERRMSRCEFK